jgi:hypothetical protein
MLSRTMSKNSKGKLQVSVSVRSVVIALVVFTAPLVTTSAQRLPASQLRFEISFPAASSAKPLDGRMLLLISNNNTREPRLQISEDPTTQQVFGIDVDGLKPDEPATVDAGAFGYPVRSISQLKPGEYWVQALLHVYETFRRKDGHTVKLPMDRGEGQQWSRAPGNLYSTPVKLTIDPGKGASIKITLDKIIPPIEPPKDTKYIKHIKIQSKLLTEFWGRPMHIGAHVLLPEGFDEHPNARYPLAIFHGHFPSNISNFRETPPDPNLKPDYSERFKLEGYNRIVQEHAHQFYKEWTGPNFPRMLMIEIQHANPYYDDSYAVNSANLGPYGDAITYELIPYIEEKFRGIGKGWARVMYGGSTGGWEAMAAQVFYPDEYNGAYIACPDPIDFRAYMVVDIYRHKNAYYIDDSWKRTPRPGKRNYLGELAATIEDMNHMELALGTKSRSGGQFDIWEAVYSPVGPDGYPKPIWNKLTGEIDRSVAEHWRENYDLGYILRRDWKKLGPKLAGKLHIYVGEADNYYLNNAVYLVEDFLKTTKDPPYGGEVDYEPRAEHCWNGDHTRPNALSRLRYHQMFMPRAVERMLKTAPPGADLKSWRY